MLDLHLEIRRGPSYPDPKIKGRGWGWVSKNIFFRPFGPKFGLKVRGGKPPGPLPWIRPEIVQLTIY